MSDLTRSARMAGLPHSRGDANRVVDRITSGIGDGDLSSRIANRLLARGFTAQGLAATLGVGKSFISLIKSGKQSFRLEHLQLLEKAAGVPLPVLLLEADLANLEAGKHRASLQATIEAIKKSYEVRQKLMKRMLS